MMSTEVKFLLLILPPIVIWVLFQLYALTPLLALIAVLSAPILFEFSQRKESGK